MNHPASCKNPDDCTLTYREHLVGFSLGAGAIPTRVSEETKATLVREKRWSRDMDAYQRLRNDGMQPPQIDGSALREKQGEDMYDINHREVTIDYADAS